MKTLLMMIALMLVGISVNAQDSTTVTFNWTAVGDDGNIGTAASYDFRYSLTPLTLATWNTGIVVPTSTTIVPKVAGSAETYTTKFLFSSQTRYYFYIRAIDEANNIGGISNQKVYDSPDNIPPAAIINLETVN